MEISKEHLLTKMMDKTPEKHVSETVTAEVSHGADTGIIQREIVSATIQEALLAALKALGFKPTKENMKLASMLFEVNLPVNKENLMKLNQSMKLTGGEEGKSLFLLENNLRANPKNDAILTQLIEGKHGLGEGIKNLFQAVAEIKEPELKNILTEIFSEETAANGAAEEIKDPSAIGEVPDNAKSSRKETGEALPAREGLKTLEESPTLPKEPSLKEGVSKEEIPKENALKEEVPGDGALEEGILKEGLSKEGILKEGISQEGISKEGISKDEALKFNKNELNDNTFEKAQDKAPSAKDTLSEDKPLHRSKLLFSPRGEDAREIDDYLSGLKDKLVQAREQLAKYSSPEAAKALKEAANIEERIEFITQIKNDIFIQLPLNIHNHETEGELFVFKDKKGGKKSKEAVSALIALDTACLGRFEVYVCKDGRKVNCQFRLAGSSVERLVRENLSDLSNLLEQHNYILEASTFKKLEEPFTLLKKEPLPEETGNGLRKNYPMDRISFDIRT